MTYPLTLKCLASDTCLADADADADADVDGAAELAYANKNKERPCTLSG